DPLPDRPRPARPALRLAQPPVEAPVPDDELHRTDRPLRHAREARARAELVTLAARRTDLRVAHDRVSCRRAEREHAPARVEVDLRRREYVDTVDRLEDPRERLRGGRGCR